MNSRTHYAIQWWHLDIDGVFTWERRYRWLWQARVKRWMAQRTLSGGGKRQFYVVEWEYESQPMIRRNPSTSV